MTIWPPMPGPNFNGFWVESPNSLVMKIETSRQPAWKNFLNYVRANRPVKQGPILVGEVKRELDKYNAEIIHATDRYAFINFENPEQCTMFLLRWQHE